jgi:hypothetical protein
MEQSGGRDSLRKELKGGSSATVISYTTYDLLHLAICDYLEKAMINDEKAAAARVAAASAAAAEAVAVAAAAEAAAAAMVPVAAAAATIAEAVAAAEADAMKEAKKCLDDWFKKCLNDWFNDVVNKDVVNSDAFLELKFVISPDRPDLTFDKLTDESMIPGVVEKLTATALLILGFNTEAHLDDNNKSDPLFNEDFFYDNYEELKTNPDVDDLYRVKFPDKVTILIKKMNEIADIYETHAVERRVAVHRAAVHGRVMVPLPGYADPVSHTPHPALVAHTPPWSVPGSNSDDTTDNDDNDEFMTPDSPPLSQVWSQQDGRWSREWSTNVSPRQNRKRKSATQVDTGEAEREVHVGGVEVGPIVKRKMWGVGP